MKDLNLWIKILHSTQNDKDMLNQLVISTSKILSKLSQVFNLGNGSTWPGHIALGVNPHIIQDILKNSSTQIILVIGTNGKTTTSLMLSHILEEDGKKIIRNESRANLLNGIASTILVHTKNNKVIADYAVFEVDENNLPVVLEHLTPKMIIALNLFRDQLDRYGELDSIAKSWNDSFQTLTHSTILILNSDDPLIAYLAKDVKANTHYFGLNQKEKSQTELEHSADSIYCPNCDHKLSYKKVFYSHLGLWKCTNCSFKRPDPYYNNVFYPLPGTYNKYNTLAAFVAAKELGISSKTIDKALHTISPAFGRQEKLIYNGKHVQLFLSKNPTSMNQSLETVLELSQKTKPAILFVLNDRIPDGRDVSWIWDINMEEYVDRFEKIIISGDRCYDMALRMQYSFNAQLAVNRKMIIEEDLQKAIQEALEQTKFNETLYILPTYSAMLEARKILTGKKIL